MAKFEVNQIVLCEVRVSYFVEAVNHQEALRIASENDSPTDRSADGCDYEIISDNAILKTTLKEVNHE